MWDCKVVEFVDVKVVRVVEDLKLELTLVDPKDFKIKRLGEGVLVWITGNSQKITVTVGDFLPHEMQLGTGYSAGDSKFPDIQLDFSFQRPINDSICTPMLTIVKTFI